MSQSRSEWIAWIASGASALGALRLWADGDPGWAALLLVLAAILAGILAFQRWTELRSERERRALAAQEAADGGLARLRRGGPRSPEACRCRSSRATDPA